MRVCDICMRGTIVQKSGAHQYGGGWAMRATKKRKIWQINLHASKVTYGGVRRTMRLCTKCLRRVKAGMAPVEKKEILTSEAPIVATA